MGKQGVVSEEYALIPGVCEQAAQEGALKPPVPRACSTEEVALLLHALNPSLTPVEQVRRGCA
jgi:hypothetical protein